MTELDQILSKPKYRLANGRVWVTETETVKDEYGNVIKTDTWVEVTDAAAPERITGLKITGGQSVPKGESKLLN